MVVSSRYLMWLVFTGAVIAPTVAAAGTGNPYNFYASVADCAAAEQSRCDACVPAGSCGSITSLGDGLAECTLFAENAGRGYSLVCINFALAIDTVASCTASRAPGCARDPNASGSLSTLDNNAVFLDDATCGAALDGCLATSYGTAPSGSSGTSVDTSGDTSCDASCDGGGDDSGGDASCDDSSSDDSGGSCDGGGDSGGGDCGGGDGGGDCSGDEGSSCGEGGGDCDSGGGGGDCSAGKHHGHGGGLAIAIAWAFLPLPFASFISRRGRRRRRQP